jgi:hypothetical protein
LINGVDIDENMEVAGRFMLDDEMERMANDQVQKNINLGSGGGVKNTQIFSVFFHTSGEKKAIQ